MTLTMIAALALYLGAGGIVTMIVIDSIDAAVDELVWRHGIRHRPWLIAAVILGVLTWPLLILCGFEKPDDRDDDDGGGE